MNTKGVVGDCAKQQLRRVALRNARTEVQTDSMLAVKVL